MKYIRLNHNKRAIIDNEDYAELSQYHWFARWNGTDYRAKRMDRKDGKRIEIQMYNQIMPVSKGFEIDHANRNPLDNRKHNLRIVTRSQNQRNKGIQKNNTSGINGVYFNRFAKKWGVQKRIDGKHYSFGYYNTKAEAIEVNKKIEN
jgi:hypothetical protein